jgi:hypothetical protein
MVSTALRIVAVVTSLLVLAGFITFVNDEAGAASDQQTALIDGKESPDPSPQGEKEREADNSKAQEYIDDANDVLLKPFVSVVDSADNKWVVRGVPALLALLVYGFGLGLLANYMRGRFI